MIRSPKDKYESNSRWAERSAYAILVGLAFEVIAVIFVSPKSTTLWFTLVIPNALIWIGVAGELLFGGRARSASDELSAEAQERIAQADARAAEANEKAEKERLARVKIEARLAPRHLTSDQQERIASRLSRWAILPGTDMRQSVAVFPTTHVFESENLATLIANALTAAGWDVSRNEVHFGKPISGIGVWLLAAKSNQRGAAVAADLWRVLTDEQIFTNLLPPRDGCEELGTAPDLIEHDPACSQISVFVGDRPFMALPR